MPRTVHAIALTALLLLAGCAGGVTGGPAGSGSDTNGPADSGSDSSGRMNFYVSDEQNAIGDFKHLNVTVTAVAFQRANASVDDGAEAGGDGDGTATANATARSEMRAEIEAKQESDAWVVHDVDNLTVDLTTLQGANAAMLADFDVPAGEYETVFVYVADVNATLKTGEQVDVKLPSQKLHVTTPFTVDANTTIDFVFDITVVQRGSTGDYNLKPVVAESGTDVEIDVVAELDDNGERGEQTLSASFAGDVSAGENATLVVTNAQGEPVEGASVVVNGEFVGRTNASGELVFRVPSDADELEVEVESESGAEIEIEGSLDALVSGLLSGADGDQAGNDDAGSREGGADSGDDTSDGGSDDAQNATAELAATFTTDVVAGENATLVVTDGSGNPVEDAVVRVNGRVVGETNAEGSITFEVPADAETVEVVVVKGDVEVELETGVVAAASL